MPLLGSILGFRLGFGVWGSKRTEVIWLCGHVASRSPALSLVRPRGCRPQAPPQGVSDRCLHCEVTTSFPWVLCSLEAAYTQGWGLRCVEAITLPHPHWEHGRAHCSQFCLRPTFRTACRKFAQRPHP